MDKPIKQYIQDLVICKVNAVTHLDTTNILHKRLLYIIKQIHRELIKIIIIVTKADKSRTVVVIDNDVYQ
jgi:hypothetical protein